MFESALSFRIMLETDRIDLTANFDTELVECDCAFDFPGYSVERETDRGIKGFVRLVEQ
jgi:hypothetical protein